MLIDRWFTEGVVARRAGASRDACPYPDGDTRRQWLAGFDKLVAIQIDITTVEAEVLDDARFAAKVKAWLH